MLQLKVASSVDTGAALSQVREGVGGEVAQQGLAQLSSYSGSVARFHVKYVATFS